MNHPSDPSAVIADLASLSRSGDDRVLAGVCGGIARQLHVDPVIIRVLVVVLSFFGGVGVLLYAIGWLVLPDDKDDNGSLLNRALGNGAPGRVRSAAIAIALGLLIVAVGSSGVFGRWSPSLLLVLAIIGLIALLNRERRAGYTARASEPPSWPPAGPAGAPAGPWSAPPGTPYETTAPAPDPPPAAVAAPTDAEAATSTEPQAWVSPPWVAPPWVAPADDGGPSWPGDPSATASLGVSPPPPQPPRPRSYLGILTVSAVVLMLGTLGIVDAAGVAVSPVAYFFTALGMIGLALVVGTWFGRSRGLIALGVVAVVIFTPVAILDGVTDGRWVHWSGSERIRESPTTANDIRSSYQLDTGQLILDLRGADFTDRDVTTSIGVGAGEIRVLLPANVDVEVTGHVGLGQVDLLQDRAGGADRDLTVSDNGADGVGSGSLNLQLSADIGHVEVIREAA